MSYEKTKVGVVMTILLAGGGMVYLQETDNYKNCPGNWEFLEDSGQYYCESRDLTEWCHHLSSSNYRCYLGILVEEEKITYENSIIRKGDKWWTTDGEVCYYKGDLKQVESCP